MASVTCSSTGTGDFSLVVDGVSYQCTTDAPPFVLVESGQLTKDEFDVLWPLIIVLMVTGYIAGVLRRQF